MKYIDNFVIAIILINQQYSEIISDKKACKRKNT